MSQIVRDTEAFSNDMTGGKKRPRVEDGPHLAFIRTLPCLICGGASVAAHIKYRDARFAKHFAGNNVKADDKWTVPLCPQCHTDGPHAQHKSPERQWWARQQIDPVRVAAALFIFTGDREAAMVIVRNARIA